MRPAQLRHKKHYEKELPLKNLKKSNEEGKAAFRRRKKASKVKKAAAELEEIVRKAMKFRDRGRRTATAPYFIQR